MRIWLSFITIILGIGLSVANADYEAGKRAYNDGDYETAYEVWLPLAEDGNVKAAHKLGYMNSQGLGRPVDFIKAQHWYLIAAKQGKASSQYNLGHILLGGLTRTYIVESICWLVLAKNKDYEAAIELYSVLKYETDTPDKIFKLAEEQSKGWCTTAPLP